MIFTWNGERFQFITDVLGVAPLGASSGDGQLLPGGSRRVRLHPRRDRSASATAPTTCASPRSCARSPTSTRSSCIAVDHPAGIEIVTNEKFKSPPFPEFRLFGVDQRIYPAAARDQRGANVLAGAAAPRPRRIPTRFRRDAAGVAELHTLDLDFGKRRARQPRRAHPARLGGLGRRQHVPRRHAGAQGSDLPVPPGEGRRRPVEDRDRRHGHPLRQAEDHGGGSQRQVPLRLARGAHRDQPVRLLGRDLPGGERRDAARPPHHSAFALGGSRNSAASPAPPSTRSANSPNSSTIRP